jgi:hypothetical protein
MYRISLLGTLTFLSLFVFVEIAQAGLIRGGGRGELTRDYDQQLYYVNDRFTNAAGIDFRAIEDNYDGDDQFFAQRNRDTQLAWASSTAFINGDINPISAFPAGEGCTRGYDAGEVAADRERLRFLEDIGGDGRTDFDNDELAQLRASLAEVDVNDPCKWQFGEDEQISVEGLFQVVFAGVGADEVQYAVNWVIDGVSHGGELIAGDGNRFGALVLNKDIDLAPGEYPISVSVSISSMLGSFYYENPGPEDGSETPVELGERCVDNPDYIELSGFIEQYLIDNSSATEDDAYDAYDALPDSVKDDLVCGFTGILQDFFADSPNPELVNPPTAFWSFTETLIIVAGEGEEPVISANAPATLGVLITALAALGIRRKAIKNK